MKPSIPDTGTVVRLEGENAVIRMKHEGSCRKCGAAAIGLCKGGMRQELTVRNPKRARIGDTVKIGLGKGIQYQGYILAYVIPPAALLFGSVGGHYLSAFAGIPALDIVLGLFSMFVMSFISFKRLKRLDSSHSIEIVRVLFNYGISGAPQSDDDTIDDYYLEVR